MEAMGGVLTGFAIIGAIIAAGTSSPRRAARPARPVVMSRLAFFVLMPCLLFHTIATAHIESLVSPMLWVSLISAVTVALVAVLVFRLVLRRSRRDDDGGALASGYVNANNIGLPVASVYVARPATAVVPVILLQLVVLAPLALTVLDAATATGGTWRRAGSPDPSATRSSSRVAARLWVCSALRIEIPTPVPRAVRPRRGRRVPVVLLSFGMSLHGSTPLRDPRSGRTCSWPPG